MYIPSVTDVVSTDMREARGKKEKKKRNQSSVDISYKQSASEDIWL